MEILSLVLFLAYFFPLAKLAGRIFAGKLISLPAVSIQLLMGLIVLIGFFAAFLTKGKTILLLIPVFFIFQLISSFKSVKAEFNIAFLKELKYSFLLSILLTVILVPLAIIPLGSTAVLTGDYLFYGKLASYMTETGFETKNLNYFQTTTNYTEIYHYVDVWFFGMIRKITGLNSNQSVFAGIFIVFVTIVFQAQLDLFNYLKKNRFNWLFSLSALGVLIQLSGATYFFNAIFGLNEFGDFCGLAFPKLILLYAFFLVFVLIALRSEFGALLALGGIYSLCFTTVLPVYVGLSGTIFLKEYKWNSFRKEKLLTIMPLALILVYLGVFYSLFSAQKQTGLMYESHLSFDWSGIRTRINIFGKTSIYMILGFLPLLAFGLLNRKAPRFQECKKVIGYGVVGAFVGLASWTLIYHKADAVQLWSNFYYPMIGVVYVTVAYFLAAEKKYLQFLGMLAILGLDLAIPAIKMTYIQGTDCKIRSYRMLDNQKLALFEYYDPALNVYSRNDAVYFGRNLELMSFSTPKMISFSAVEIYPKDAIYEQVIRQSHLYQLQPFPLGKEEKAYVPYQDSMLSALDIKYVAISKRRKFPLVLNNRELHLLPVDSEAFLFYRISKKKK